MVKNLLKFCKSLVFRARIPAMDTPEGEILIIDTLSQNCQKFDETFKNWSKVLEVIPKSVLWLKSY